MCVMVTCFNLYTKITTVGAPQSVAAVRPLITQNNLYTGLPSRPTASLGSPYRIISKN